MANMDVTATFRADVTDFQRKVQGMNTLYKDSAGRWRTETGQFASAAERAAAGVRGMGDSAKQASGGFTILKNAIGTAVGAAAVGVIYKFGRGISNLRREVFDLAVESRKTEVRIEAIARAMGLTTGSMEGMTKRVIDQAAEFQNLTGVSDETIKSAQALILTFKDVASSANETGGVFDRTTMAALDLSAAGFGDIEGSAKSLARALQDPTRGLMMLGRQGVTFTKQEQDKIKALVESNELHEAQEMILAAVEQQVGGTAQATMRESDRMAAAITDVKEAIGLALLPAVESIQRAITDNVLPVLMRMVEYFQNNIAPVVENVIGNIIQGFKDFVPTLQMMVDRVRDLAPLLLTMASAAGVGYAAFKLYSLVPATFAKIGLAINATTGKIMLMNAAVLANPVVAVAALAIGAFAAMAGAFKLVYDRSEELRKAVSDLVNTVKAIVGTIAGEVIAVFKSLMGVQDDAAGSAKSFGDIIQQVADVVGPILSKAVDLVTGYLKVYFNVVRIGLKVFEVFGTLVKMAAQLLRAAFIVAVQRARDALSGLLDRLGPLGRGIRNLVQGIASGFSQAAEAVRGAMQNVGGFVEGAVNFAIDAINMLIRAYNALPFVDGVAEIGRFELSGFNLAQQAVTRLADATHEHADAAARARRLNDELAGSLTDSGDAADENTGKTKAGGAAAKEKSDAVEALMNKLKEYQQAMQQSAQASDELRAATSKLPPQFAHLNEVIGDLVETPIEQAFGPGGAIGGVISQFDQLSTSIDKFYKPLLNVELFGRAAVRAARQAMNSAKGFLQAATETALTLMAQRDRVRKALQALEDEYRTGTQRINARYDAMMAAERDNLNNLQAHHAGMVKAQQNHIRNLRKHYENAEKAAKANLDSIRKHYDGIVTALRDNLRKATEAFNVENNILQNLIQQRNRFTEQIQSGFRSFVNSLSFQTSQATKQVVRETKRLANGIIVTFEREIEVAGKSENLADALESRLQTVREFATNIRTLMARGVDPSLVQEFISAGVSGAGDVVRELTSASEDEIARINAVQKSMADEIANFQEYGVQQFHEGAIAQQEAIVAPLEAARDAAMQALEMAEQARDRDLESAQRHLDAIIEMRDRDLDNAQAYLESLEAQKDHEIAMAQAALEQLQHDRDAALELELANYEQRKDALEQEGQEVEDALTKNARMVNQRLSNLQNTLPPRMARAGRMAMNGLIRGLKRREPAVMAEARRIAAAIEATIRAALQTRSPSRVTADIGMDVAAGLARGMEQGTRAVSLQAGDMGRAAIPTIRPAGGGGASSGAVINITVNAPPLTDPAEVGRQAVEAIRKYERRSGPVFVSA